MFYIGASYQGDSTMFYIGASYRRDFSKFYFGTSYQWGSSKFYFGTSFQRNFNFRGSSLPELSEKAQSGHWCCVSGSGPRAD